MLLPWGCCVAYAHASKAHKQKANEEERESRIDFGRGFESVREKKQTIVILTDVSTLSRGVEIFPHTLFAAVFGLGLMRGKIYRSDQLERCSFSCLSS